MAKSKLTPAMQQFMRIKQKYPDTILLFRMGDFYETFFEDAKTAARVLGIALTSRSKGSDRIPMAGVPYHAGSTYIRKLIKANYRVAICEQLEDPATAKGLVKRDVVEVVTPGTLTDEDSLERSLENFLAAIAVNTRAREVMLPIMLLPLAIPALIASVQATGVLVEGGRWGMPRDGSACWSSMT